MVRQSTRFFALPNMNAIIRPEVQNRVDSSVYFVRFDVFEPKDGTSELQLGNWVELQDDFDNANGVPPSRSKDNYDAGLYKSELVPHDQCTSNMRVAVVDVQQWPIKVLLNFTG